MGTGASSRSKKITRHITDVVKVEEENVIFDWVLLDFDAWLSSQTYEKKSSIFQGAQRLGRSSHWYLRLSREPYEPDLVTVGIYLHSAERVIDRPKDIRAHVALFLLDPYLKEARSFGYTVKTFTSASAFGGPSLFPDSFEWRWNTSALKQEQKDLFEGNTLRIRLRMTLFGAPWSIMTEKDSCHCGSESVDFSQREGESLLFPDVPVPLNTASLWTNRQGADCVILCGGYNFLAHMNVLAQQSLILYSAFQYNLSQGEEDALNGNGNRITLRLEDIDPQVLEATLKFIYRGNLDDMREGDGGTEWNHKLAGGILRTAKRFGLPKLQAYCLAKLAAELTCANVGESAVLAYEYYATQPIVRKIHRFIAGTNKPDSQIRGHLNFFRICSYRNIEELEQNEEFKRLQAEYPSAFPNNTT